MLAEMYRNREKLAFLFLILTVLTIIGWLIFQTPDTDREWAEVLFFLFPVGLIFSIIFTNRLHYNKVKHKKISNSPRRLVDIKEVVIKKDTTYIPRLLLFEKSGEFIGSADMVGMAWWMYPLRILNDSLIMFFPMTYVMTAHDGRNLITFRKSGWINRAELKIYNKEKQKIGIYTQEKLKSLFRIQGELYSGKGEPVLSVKASNFSGDFSWIDKEGKRWAHFYNGMFPHEYSDLFRDSKNDIVELSNELSEEDKLSLLAVIVYLFFPKAN